MKVVDTPSTGEDIKIVTGCLHGPFNRLQDPLPYDTAVPNAPVPLGAPIPTSTPASVSPALITATPATTTPPKPSSHPQPPNPSTLSTSSSAAGAAAGAAAPPQSTALTAVGSAQLQPAAGVPHAPSRRRTTLAEALNVQADMEDLQQEAARPEGRLVGEEELMPLPYRPPVVWRYVWDIVAGTWELVLYVAVMLLAIMLETNARQFRSGNDFERWWVYLYKVVVIAYPAGVMFLQFLLVCEFTLRKFLFHRLLSFGLLLHFRPKRIWNTWFAFIFVAVWVILNVWAWWGLVEFWGTNGRDGPEPTSFAVFGVVNVVSFHLFIHYRRLLDEEKRLLKPLQAYLLPTTVVVVPEYAVTQEAWRALRTALFGVCWPGPILFDVDWVRQQGVVVPRGYKGTAEQAEAEVDALAAKQLQQQQQGPSKVHEVIWDHDRDDCNGGSGGLEGRDGKPGGVMAGVDGANREDGARQQQVQLANAAPKQHNGMDRAPGGGGGVPGAGVGAAAAGVAAAAALEEEATPANSNGDTGYYSVTTASEHTPAASGRPPSPSAPGPGAVAEGKEGLQAHSGEPQPPPPPQREEPPRSLRGAAAVATWGACRRCCVGAFRCYCACCCWFVYWFNPSNCYPTGFYALPLSMLAAVSCKPVWPFRRDPSYLRVLMGAVAVATCLVAGTVVFGAWLVWREPPVCQWGKDACHDCYLYEEEYVQFDQVCPASGFDISTPFQDPDYFDPNCPGGRDWFTNGVWTNNATLVMAQAGEHLYQDIPPRPLVNGYLATIMSYYAYATSFVGLRKGYEGQYMRRFRELFSGYGMRAFEFLFIDDTAVDDTQFVVTATDTDIYIIFRGTDGVTDTFITDLRGTCRDATDLFNSPCCVHSGFLAAYRQVQTQLVPAIFRVVNQVYGTPGRNITWEPSMGQPFNVWMTGHSLGGALATLCAMDLRSRGVIISGVYTYGSPRVGDPRFRDLYGSSGLDGVTYRYVHRNDVIPQVPLESMGFVHVSQPFLLMGGKCLAWPASECPQKGTLTGCAWSTADHLLPGYLGNLHACIDRTAFLPNCTEAMMPVWSNFAGVE